MKVFKNKKQRFVAVFLSLVFAFMLVPFTDAYASESYYFTVGYDDKKDDSKDREWTISAVGDSTVYCFLCEPQPRSGNSEFIFVSNTSFKLEGDRVSLPVVRNSSNGNYEPNYSSSAKGVFYAYTYCTFSTTTSTNYVLNYIFIPWNGEDYYNRLAKFFKNGDDTGFDYSNSITEGGYSNEIGALKNVSRNTLYPDHANNVDSVFWRFRYASKTTKGYNVKTSGTKIRVYESVTYYKRSDDSVYSESPKVLVGEFDATGLQFDMDVNEAFNKTTSETDSQYIANAWTILTKQIVRNDRIYLQVVDAKGNCGDYLRIGGHADNASNATDNPQTVVDEDGNEVSEENGGYSKDDTDGDVGTSIDGDLDSADDDANSKPEEKENIGDSLDHAIATIRSLIDMIRHIPEIISILFSFLPTWCLSVVALGFVALVVLIAYKLIRG